MHISRLVLHNFRGFADLVVEPSPGVNVYIGRNGQGKTTVLDAAALALSWFTARCTNRNSSGKSIQNNDIRIGQHEASITIEVQQDSRTVEWVVFGYQAGPEARRKNDFTRLNLYLDDYAASYRDEAGTLPLVCYYPTTRSFVDVPERIRKRHDLHEGAAVYDGSLDIGADFRSFFEWFKDEEDAENEAARISPDYHSPVLDSVRLAIQKFTDFTGLRIKRRPRVRMILEKEDEEIEVSQLSDGEQIFLALVGDLARRAMLARGPADARNVLAQTQGIVMIDEIELHLHPRWQREVLAKLHATFPRIQFLVTTHSPQVVGEASRESSWLLDRSSGLSPLRLAYGSTSDLILETLMETSSRSAKVQEKIDSIYRLIDAAHLHEARVALEELRFDIGDDPETTRIAAVIKRCEVLGR